MKEYRVPIQSLIDHIKTATDVDPWAKEMVDELLKEQEAVVRCNDCKYWLPMDRFHQDYHPGRGDCELNCWVRDSDWFCADGERREYVKPQAESATDWDGVECE